MKKINSLNQGIIFAFFIVLASLIFTFMSQSKQNKLEVYTDSNIISTEILTTESINIDTFIYENLEFGFSLKLPIGWEKVIQNGYDTYIHRESSSSIQIQLLPYDPNINMITAEYLSSALVSEGYTFIGFSKKTSSSYEVSYQTKNQSQYDYIEEVFWNRDCIVKLVCILKNEHYEKMYPYYQEIISSFCWNNSNLIPPEYYLYYNNQANFEFAIPINWNVGYTDTALVATNAEATAQMLITVSENNATLENISALDITNLLKKNKSNFILKEFYTSKTKTVAKAAYNNSTPALNYTIIYSNGIYMYTLQFDYYEGCLDESIINTCDILFREFVTKNIIQDSEIATKTDVNK